MDHSRLDRRSWRACAACVCGWALLLATSGCSHKPPDAKGTEEDARAALASGLDAWLAGHQPDVLQDGTPPVWMIDQDWRAGKTLKAYRTPETPEKFGGHWKVATTITVGGAGGPDEEKRVAYAVTLARAIHITRADDGDIPTD